MKKILLITSIIFIAVFSRLLPHIDNFTPIAAIALFGASCLDDKRLAFLIPLISMFISDIFLGFHSTILYVYVSFILTSFIGISIKENNIKNITMASLASSVLFFMITNFGHWISTGKEISLVETYIAGIPFFRMTLIGDLFYTFILFGAFYFAQIKLKLKNI